MEARDACYTEKVSAFTNSVTENQLLSEELAIRLAEGSYKQNTERKLESVIPDQAEVLVRG